MSDLIRQLRHGGPAALAAAKRLLEAKVKLSPIEVAEVKLLLPQLKDLFGASLSEGLSTLLSGFEVAVPVPVELLMPKPEQVKEPKQLPARFIAELPLVRPQLVNHPALSREEKATRLFAFLVPFAQVMVKLPVEVRAEVAPRLLEHAEQTGFGQLKDLPTGRDGVQVAAKLFEAKSPEEVKEQVKALKLDAPTWEQSAPKAEAKPDAPSPVHPERNVREANVESKGAQDLHPPATHEPDAKSTVQTPQPNALQAGVLTSPREQRTDAAPDASPSSRGSKRLGPQMLWNVLHLFRDDGNDGRESAAQRETMNRLAIGMALALALLTLIAVLVALTSY